MRVLLEGYRLAQTDQFGGVDSYWRQIVPLLLAQRAPEDRIALLTAFLNPRHARTYRPYVDAGAQLRHWWAKPSWLAAASRLGMDTAHFGGPHDLLHIAEPAWELRTRGPVVVTAHDLMYLHHPQFLAPAWVERLQRGTEDLAQRAALWICVSAHTRDDLIANYGIPRGRTVVVHHGVDPRFRGLHERPEIAATVRHRMELGNKPYFLFLGSVEPKKNLGMLLEAYGLAVAQGLNANLVVAGRAGWQSDTVRRAAERYPALEGRVRFTGFVADEDLPGLVAGARAMVLPSRYEGFGMPVVEAMAAGTPVICSNRGALPEVSGGAALHFDADDVDALAEHLREVDGSDKLCEELQRHGLDRAADFDWEDCAAQTWQAYRTALALPR